jgi:hypothetical protein
MLQGLNHQLSAVRFRASHESVEADRYRHYISVVVISMFAKQVDASWGSEDIALATKSLMELHWEIF